MTTSNTRDCFTECIGHKVVGVLFDALPCGRRDIAAGTKTLVLDDGRGLTISSSGSFWINNADDVRRAVQSVKHDLKETQRRLEGVLEVAGAMP